jgi:hypothetical protein
MDARAIPLRRAIIEEALGSRGSEDGERRQGGAKTGKGERRQALRRSRSGGAKTGIASIQERRQGERRQGERRKALRRWI